MLKIVLFSFMENGYLSLTNKVFNKISEVIDKINNEDLVSFGLKIEKREEYAIEYIEEILNKYVELLNIDVNTFVQGKGKRKTSHQKNHEVLEEYCYK